MKFVIRPYHMMSLGGYIVEFDFPYRDIIIVNKSSEDIKFEIPVFDESWIEETRALGLEVIPVREEDSYLNMYRKAHADLEAFKAKLE
ncbi:energy-converting hydrogenase B subunit P [uncultured Methanobrevibacter sp.]|mgnify:CR=1 FL=1|uniref:energy-converting hydrogenase B subunit P n=1 Tax=uncultured Methanobrevibacter sp. TaxID=253161 RepID=UPI0026027C08